MAAYETKYMNISHDLCITPRTVSSIVLLHRVDGSNLRSFTGLVTLEPRLARSTAHTTFLNLSFYIMCMVFRMCVCAVFLQCLWRTEDVVRSSGTRVTHGGKPPCRYWDSNPSPLGQPLVLLRISTAPNDDVLLPSKTATGTTYSTLTHEPRQAQAPGAGLPQAISSTVLISITGFALAKPSERSRED